MSQKHKGMVNDHGRSVSREKMVPVAPGSQQGKAPGSGPGNRQAAAPAMLARQGGNDAGSRAGPGTQTGTRSARQQAQRMQARAEQDRLGMSQQSGHGGLEQDQHAGSKESALAPSGRNRS
jgi:hypothetical protein